MSLSWLPFDDGKNFYFEVFQVNPVERLFSYIVQCAQNGITRHEVAMIAEILK